MAHSGGRGKDAQVKLRRAEITDAGFLFRCANEPDMIKARVIEKAIEWTEHLRWLSKVLVDEDVHLFIAEVDGEKIGEIRFDCDGDTADVGLVVRAEHRGHGYGTQMIETGISRVPKETYTAKIKSDNVASARCFTRAGFKQVSETEWERL